MTENRSEPPRDLLVRMAPGLELRAEGDGRLLVGYAAVFNTDTVIDSWEGKFVERIAPGAFKRTLRERRDQIKVLFNHGYDPQVGDKPLGKPRVMKEDNRGLYVEVPMDDTSYNQDLIASLRSGAIDGMSFRFSVTRETWTDPKDKKSLPVRTIEEVKLYEFGPVTFPAYAATEAGVRSQVWQSITPQARAEIVRILTTPEKVSGPGDSREPANRSHSRLSIERARWALIERGITT